MDWCFQVCAKCCLVLAKNQIRLAGQWSILTPPRSGSVAKQDRKANEPGQISVDRGRNSYFNNYYSWSGCLVT